MSQTVTRSDPGPAGIERPPGLNRDGPVMFTAIASEPVDDDLRTLECVMCDYAKDVRVHKDMMGWINSRELRPPS